MSDQYDEQAAALRNDIERAIDVKIAAALRELGAENERLWTDHDSALKAIEAQHAMSFERDALRQQLAEKALERQELTRTFTATIERLERENADIRQQLAAKDAEIAKLKAENKRLRAAWELAQEEMNVTVAQSNCLRQQLAAEEAGHAKTAKQFVDMMAVLAATERERDEAQAIIQAHANGKCYPCGWTLAPSAELGCVPGNCSYRPTERSPDYERWLQRQRAERKWLAAHGTPQADEEKSNG